MLWAIDTGIDLRAALKSIPVSIAHSGADYLLPDEGSAGRSDYTVLRLP
jgi:hypothetical protein